MMPGYTLRIHPDFITDLKLAILYYSGISVVVSDKFKAKVAEQLKLIRKHASVNSIRYDDIRFGRVPKFPYAIHYYIDDESKTIVIQSLLSDYRNPELYWVKK